MKAAFFTAAVIVTFILSACGRSVKDYTYADWKSLGQHQQWELLGGLDGHEAMLLVGQTVILSREDTIDPNVTIAELIDRGRVELELKMLDRTIENAAGRSVEDYTFIEWEALDEGQQWELYGHLTGHEAILLYAQSISCGHDTINPHAKVGELLDRGWKMVEEQESKRAREQTGAEAGGGGSQQ